MGFVDAVQLLTGGTSSLALTAFLERHAEIDRVTLCLDADEAGRLGAERIIAQLRDTPQFAHIAAEYRPPEFGKDYNDTALAARLELQKPAHPRKSVST